MRVIHFLALFLITLSACEQDPTEPISLGNRVNFADLQPGQVSHFVRYETNCGNGSSGFQFTGDTLKLEVIQAQDTFYLQESVSPYSPLYLDGVFTEPVSYPIFGEKDRVRVPERWNSALFFFYGNDTLHLTSPSWPRMEQDNCLVTLNEQIFQGNEIGFIDRFTLGPIRQRNKTVVSCVPNWVQLDAYLFYTNKQLYMSHTVASDGNVGGWVMIAPTSAD